MRFIIAMFIPNILHSQPCVAWNKLDEFIWLNISYFCKLYYDECIANGHQTFRYAVEQISLRKPIILLQKKKPPSLPSFLRQPWKLFSKFYTIVNIKYLLTLMNLIDQQLTNHVLCIINVEQKSISFTSFWDIVLSNERFAWSVSENLVNHKYKSCK